MTRMMSSRLPEPPVETFRREWLSFAHWYASEQKAMSVRLRESLNQNATADSSNPRETIKTFKEETLASSRVEWLTRLRRVGLNPEDWVMSAEDEEAVRSALCWSKGDMVENAREAETRTTREERGKATIMSSRSQPARAMYEFVNPSTLQDDGWKASDLKRGEQRAYSQRAVEAGRFKRTVPGSAPRGPVPVTVAPMISAPRIPMYYIAPLLSEVPSEEPSELQEFALVMSEHKIKEYYQEACEATIQFQRRLSRLTMDKAQVTRAEFDAAMRRLAIQKAKEWEAIVAEEMKKSQIEEFERQRAEARARVHAPASDLGRGVPTVAHAELPQPIGTKRKANTDAVGTGRGAPASAELHRGNAIRRPPAHVVAPLALRQKKTQGQPTDHMPTRVPGDSLVQSTDDGVTTGKADGTRLNVTIEEVEDEDEHPWVRHSTGADENVGEGRTPRVPLATNSAGQNKVPRAVKDWKFSQASWGGGGTRPHPESTEGNYALVSRGLKGPIEAQTSRHVRFGPGSDSGSNTGGMTPRSAQTTSSDLKGGFDPRVLGKRSTELPVHARVKEVWDGEHKLAV